MTSNQATETNNGRVYHEYEPPFEWQTDDGLNTLLVFLPGYQRQSLRVQIISNSKIRISGERHESENKWRRFLKEVPTPPDSNTNLISANFENGMLCVKVPKATDNTKPLHEVTKKPIQETPNPEKPTIPSNQTQGLQKNGYQEKVPSKTSNRSNNIDEIKQVVQGLFRETKKNRFTDVIMAVIFLLCVGFYVKNAIINLKKESKTSEL